LIVDSVLGLKPVVKTQITSAENIFPGLEYVRGVARVAGHDEMILIHDLTKFLSETEEIDLDRALAGSPAP
jgi:purine-binding chemotaxis protein CheW